MKKQIDTSVLKNKNGSALVVCLLILSAITIIGFSAINSSNVEVLLSQNDLIFKRNLYSSEAGIMEGAQALEDESEEDLRPHYPNGPGGGAKYQQDWLNTKDVNMQNLNSWTEENSVASNIPDTLISIVDGKVSRGSSLEVDKPTLHSLSIYGYCDPGNGSTFVEIGYKKRF